jgi:rhamnose transport system ATP-binding protein
MYSRSSAILQSLGVQLDPHRKVRGLSIADQQMVEMAGALSQDAKILLMDEPTAALTPNEVDELFKNMRKLRDQGTAIVFISHRLEEIFQICDRITVLRDGELVGVREPADASIDQIIRMMVGRPLSTLFAKGNGHEVGAPILEVEGLSRTMKFEDISFQVRAGEIVGIAGLVGSGRTEVARALFGALDIDRGIVRLEGKEVKINHPREALAKGLIYLPEDRQHHALLMPMSVTNNMTLTILSRLAKGGWLRDRSERAVTQEYVDKLRINLRDISQPVSELSGGNQQKVVLSKWLLAQPKVMILDEPTRGIDIGAKSEVHRLMGELANQGIGILMISSELPEILAMSDRIIVMREGRITGLFDKSEATAERIMAAATAQVLEGQDF